MFQKPSVDKRLITTTLDWDDSGIPEAGVLMPRSLLHQITSNDVDEGRGEDTIRPCIL